MNVCTRELSRSGRGEESEGAVGVEIQIKMMGEEKMEEKRMRRGKDGWITSLTQWT